MRHCVCVSGSPPLALAACVYLIFEDSVNPQTLRASGDGAAPAERIQADSSEVFTGVRWGQPGEGHSSLLPPYVCHLTPPPLPMPLPLPLPAPPHLSRAAWKLSSPPPSSSSSWMKPCSAAAQGPFKLSDLTF